MIEYKRVFDFWKTIGLTCGKFIKKFHFYPQNVTVGFNFVIVTLDQWIYCENK